MRALVVAIIAASLFTASAQAGPVGADAIATAVSAPGSRSNPREVVNVQLSTTPTAVFADQLSTSGPATQVYGSRFNNDAVTQNVVVAVDPNQGIGACVKPFAIPLPTVNATDTCAEVCAASPASAMTCGHAASTDGVWTSPGAPQPLRDTAAFCYCWRSVSGTPWAQASRIAR